MLIMRVWICYDRVLRRMDTTRGFDRIGFAGSDGEEAALGRITVAGVLDDLMRIGTLEDGDRDMEDLWWWGEDVRWNIGVER